MEGKERKKGKKAEYKGSTENKRLNRKGEERELEIKGLNRRNKWRERNRKEKGEYSKGEI